MSLRLLGQPAQHCGHCTHTPPSLAQQPPRQLLADFAGRNCGISLATTTTTTTTLN